MLVFISSLKLSCSWSRQSRSLEHRIYLYFFAYRVKLLSKFHCLKGFIISLVTFSLIWNLFYLLATNFRVFVSKLIHEIMNPFKQWNLESRFTRYAEKYRYILCSSDLDCLDQLHDNFNDEINTSIPFRSKQIKEIS
jgi:hypothetical protein